MCGSIAYQIMILRAVLKTGSADFEVAMLMRILLMMLRVLMTELVDLEVRRLDRGFKIPLCLP